MVNTANISHPSNAIDWLPAILFLFLAVSLAACSDSVGPAPVDDFISAEYVLFSAQSPALEYLREEQGSVEQHILRFSSGTITDHRLNAAGDPIGETQLTYDVSSGALRLIGCGPGSIFHVPTNMRFEDRITTTPGPEVRAECWLTLDAGTILAGDANGGLYRYRMESNEWTGENVPWDSRVTAMDLDSTASPRQLYVATATDGVFTKTEGDSNWLSLNAPAGFVADVDADIDGTVFAVIDKQLYVRRAPSYDWAPFSIPSIAGGVNRISILQVSSSESILFIARESGGLAQVYLLSSHPQFYMIVRYNSESMIDVRSSPNSPYAAVVAANPPVVYVAPQGMDLWAVVPVTISDPLTAICQSDRSGTVLIGSENGVSRFDGSPTQQSGLQGEHVLSLHYGPDGAFYCGTRSGTYRSANDGINWTRIDRGSVIVRETTGLTLLPQTCSVGSSWDAGSMIIDGNGPLLLTGRVLEHFDELILPDAQGRFDDVLVVRYARELPDGSRVDGAYFWTAYYARARGLVYIEESMTGDVHASVRHLVP
ncbi:MAG: hypothetical protein KFH87_14575 [Bacteroidetes bacterium]|nr:hypothetical protein [Bacteroidota bacterium]